jgi:hypothetical protein
MQTRQRNTGAPPMLAVAPGQETVEGMGGLPQEWVNVVARGIVSEAPAQRKRYVWGLRRVCAGVV